MLLWMVLCVFVVGEMVCMCGVGMLICFVLSVKSWLCYLGVDCCVVILLSDVLLEVVCVLLLESLICYLMYLCEVWDYVYFDVLFVD